MERGLVLEQQQVQWLVMVSERGSVQARLLEHNVRFGDPECQCLMMRLQSDLLEVLLAAAEGRLGAAQLQWSPEKALTVRHPPRQTAPNKPGSSSRATGMPSVRVDCVSVLQMCALERCVSGVRSDDG